MVVDREEAEVTPGDRSQLLVGDPLEAAARVLHDHHGVDAEEWLDRARLRSFVVGGAATGVADDVGLAEVQAERREHVDARPCT
ncbi:MAG: hypothetical protein R2746_12905 [Acidimicrobiales bacterium]